MDYQSMKIEDIIQWCVEHNQVAWLKAEAKKKVECKIYPRVKVVTAEGTKTSKADKTQPPKIEYRPITFVQLKLNFVNTFMPEIAPQKKEKKPTMFDIIESLEI